MLKETSQEKSCIQLYFFSQKKEYTSLTYSFQTFVFFSGTGKKYSFLLFHSILDEIVTKVIFSKNKKKKYGNFDETNRIQD